MANRSTIVGQVIRASVKPELSDRELLERFAIDGDQAAFAAIVHRHAAMVSGVCQRALANAQDAEDACQATFLVLAKKAASLNWQTSIANWLYATARRVARNARVAAARRQRREGRAAVPQAIAPLDQITGRELLALLDEELDRLPPPYREALVLCCLEGLTRDEAAARTGVSRATLKSRLERGRKRLGDALTKRGVALGAGLLATAAPTASVDPSSRLIETIQAAAAGNASPAIKALAKGIAMNGIVKKAVLGIAIAVATTIVGVGLSFPGVPAEKPPEKSPLAKPVAKTDGPVDEAKGDRIAFAGKVVDPDGKPVQGAKLYLLRRGELSNRRVDVSPKAETDADGRYRFDVSAIDYPKSWWSSRPQLVAKADGFGLAMLPVSAVGATDATLKLSVDLPISGRVVNLEGKPVVGAKVRAIEVAAAASDDLAAWFKMAETNGMDELSTFFEGDLPRRFGNLRSPSLPETTTDKQGRFRLSGIGRERVVTLSIEGDTIATVHLMVLTQDGKSGSFPPSRRRPKEPGKPYYRPPFDYAAAPTQPFEGRVTDLETGEPIPGVTVTQWWSETKTDKDGHYRLIGLNAGPTSLNFRPGDRLPYFTRSAPGGAKNSIQTATVDIALKRGVWITGKVVDQRTKRPIADADVIFHADGDNKKAGDYFEKGRKVDVRGRTGLDGTFRIACIPGKSWLFIQREARALSAAERPLQGDTDQKTPPDQIQTSDGKWSPRIFQAVVALDIDPAKPKEYPITIDPGINVATTLSDPDGRPVAGVIAMGWEKNWFNWSKPFPSEKVEALAFNPELPRAIIFYHPARGLALVHQPPKGDVGPWKIKLQPTATVKGRLVLPNGKPYPKASLALSFKYPGSSGPAWPPRNLPESRATTDANGMFTFTKIIGGLDYDFWYPVFEDKHNTTTTIPFRAKPGKIKDLGTITTQAPRK